VAFAAVLTISVFCTSVFTVGAESLDSTFQSWQIQNNGGHYSELNSTLRVWIEGGDYMPNIAFYRQVSPEGDFIFSCEVKATTLVSCALVVKNSLPLGDRKGFAVEFGHFGEGMFLMSREVATDVWDWKCFANGTENVWYKMQLSVFANPFRVVAEVFDENGVSMGSTSASDVIYNSVADIRYIGLYVWGYSPGDYSFRNLQTSFDSPSYLSISTESFSTTAGSAVNVFGTLCDSDGSPLPNEQVVLAYTFSGADSWIPISSALTDAAGKYVIQWVNTASGTFTLEADWRGDGTHMGVSNTTTLSFWHIYREQVLFVESNSTVSALAFNSTSSEVSFNATGPSGTTGYVVLTVAKTTLANGADVKVYFDGKSLNYSIASTEDSFLIAFSYSHSTHQIVAFFGTAVPSNQPFNVDYRVLTVVFTFIAAFIALLVVAVQKIRKNSFGAASKKTQFITRQSEKRAFTVSKSLIFSRYTIQLF
jgi:hypothetical protein